MDILYRDKNYDGYKDKKREERFKEKAITAWNKRVADTGKTLSCFKCHGTGIHKAPILDDNGEWTYKWKSCHCEICAGTGKITLALYEKLQKRMRDKE